MGDASRIRSLEVATEDLDRAQTQFPSAIRNCRDSSSRWPRSASGDLTARGGGLHWCWEHERDVTRCHADDEACSGELVSHPTDPTGEGALIDDAAEMELDELDRRLRRLSDDARWVFRFVARNAQRHPTASDSQRADDDHEQRTPCASCARLKRDDGRPTFEEMHKRRMVGARELPLCRWCYDWHRAMERLPAMDELADHHAGKYVRRSA